MALNRKKGLHEILVERAKGSASKDTPGSQPLLGLPPPPHPPPPTVNPFAVANQKKKKKEKEVLEEGEVVPHPKGAQAAEDGQRLGEGLLS